MPRVLFVCDFALTHRESETSALGAIEILCVRLVRALHRHGIQVGVLYPGPTVCLDGISYMHYSAAPPHVDVLVGCRRASVFELYKGTTSHPKILWVHDELPKAAGADTLDPTNPVTLVYVSEWQRQNYQTILPKLVTFPSHVIHNFVDPELFGISDPAHMQRSAPVYDFAYVSAFKKGFTNTAYRTRILQLARKGYRIVVVTPSYDTPPSTLKLLFEHNNIKVLPPLSRRQLLHDVYLKTRCVIGPIFRETFGCFAAESLFFGTPVIVHTRGVGALSKLVPIHVDFFLPHGLETRLTYLKPLPPDMRFHIDSAVRQWKAIF